MSETLELTKFCKHVEAVFSNYQLKYLRDENGNIYSVEIRANNDIFDTTFLRFLFERVKNYVIIITDDSACRPVVQIID